MSRRDGDVTFDATMRDRTMNARLATEKHAKTLAEILIRMQAAASEIPQRPKVDWGDTDQIHDALKYTVYAAFARGAGSSARKCPRTSDSPAKFAFCTLGGQGDGVFQELLEFFRTWASDG